MLLAVHHLSTPTLLDRLDALASTEITVDDGHLFGNIDGVCWCILHLWIPYASLILEVRDRLDVAVNL